MSPATLSSALACNPAEAAKSNGFARNFPRNTFQLETSTASIILLPINCSQNNISGMSPIKQNPRCESRTSVK